MPEKSPKDEVKENAVPNVAVTGLIVVSTVPAGTPAKSPVVDPTMAETVLVKVVLLPISASLADTPTREIAAVPLIGAAWAAGPRFWGLGEHLQVSCHPNETN